jgi:hypothetical protein
LQPNWQAPSEHALAVMLAGAVVLQLVAQLPQAVSVVFRLISQPLPQFPSQLP